MKKIFFAALLLGLLTSVSFAQRARAAAGRSGIGNQRYMAPNALALVLSCAHGFAALQQDRDPAAPGTRREQEQAPDSVNKQSNVKIFTGKIMTSGDQLVLKNTATQSTYPLDDQERAKSFAGRDVKVMGALDPITGAIHIQSIEIESGK